MVGSPPNQSKESGFVDLGPAPTGGRTAAVLRRLLHSARHQLDPRTEIRGDVSGGVSEAIGMGSDSPEDVTAPTRVDGEAVVAAGVSGRARTMCKGRGNNKRRSLESERQ